MRVISGKAKGKILKAPRGLDTRPITDMIKEALFNVLGPAVADSVFLDLFAGSGSVGLEAFSRGAHKVVFVDASTQAASIIRDNIKHCGFFEGLEVHRSDVFLALDRLTRQGWSFDYIYVDPPFTQDRIFTEIMNALGTLQLVPEEGMVILRSHRKKEMSDRYGGLVRSRVTQYGESILHYYRVDKEEKGHDGNIPGSG